jgi:hypothetical protein
MQVLALAATLALAGCDNRVSFSPTVPPVPNITPLAERTLEISGSLTAEGASCLEATILYDGNELAGARAKCPNPGGCASLHLSAKTLSVEGQHTISLQVLRQSTETVRYVGEGMALVFREGLPWVGVPIRLGPTDAALQAGESVSFGIDFVD